MTKYNFGEKLQNHELNPVLRKTAIIVISNQAVFLKYCPDFIIFSQNHGSNIKNHFFGNAYMVGDFNTSRALKNNILGSSYKAVN